MGSVTADTYEPRGAASKLIRCRDPVVLVDGPAGTGKTRAWLEKVYCCAHKYPGMRALLVRKTRASLTESVLVTWETKVMPPNDPTKEGPTRAHRQSYDFSNGSHVVVGGMDTPERVMSTEYDLIVCFEATELTENDVEMLQTRLRNGKMPYQQIGLDCNPAAPTHWLKRMSDDGRATRYPSRHEDNPAVTPEYLAVLDRLTGHRHARLRLGLWASAEGVVYPEFDASIHVVEPFAIPAGWRRIRSIDFGYTNPFVCQWWAIDGDGRMYLYREIYRTQRTVRDHAQEIKRLSAGEVYEATVADHDAEDRATLDQEGIGTIRAVKDITVGIQSVATRLRKAGDGRPRLFVVQSACVDSDGRLSDAKKPTATSQEFDGYVWPTAKDGKPIKEVPVDVDNHGMDALRYAVMYLDNGQAGIVSVAGDVKPVLVDQSETVHDRYAHRVS